MNTPSFWASGTPILLREHWQGIVWTARPVTVVQDDEACIALYMAPQTVQVLPVMPDGSLVTSFLPDAWSLMQKPWRGGGALYITTPGSWFVLMGLFSDDNTDIACWYVNLQTPYMRTAIGFDYLDQELDIVISRDVRQWRWKDELKFADAIRRGRISAEDAAHVRHVGQEIVMALEAGSFTPPHKWMSWRPPGDWTVPPLPDEALIHTV